MPHAIKVSRDGVVYVADRINNRIQMFTREGKFLKQVRVTNEGSTVVPVPAGFAFSPDASQQFLYVVDSGPMRVVIFDRQSMTQIGVVGMKGANAGEFDIVHHMASLLHEEYKESRFAPPPLLRRLVLAGYLGRKSGAGFYDYGQTPPAPRDALTRR